MASEPSGMWLLLHYDRLSKGNLPHPMADYNPLVLTALLSHMEDAVKAAETRREEEFRRRGYDGARLTGDEITDRWEREIAAGRKPTDW